jgi:hypothetical protein
MSSHLASWDRGIVLFGVLGSDVRAYDCDGGGDDHAHGHVVVRCYLHETRQRLFLASLVLRERRYFLCLQSTGPRHVR